MLQIIKGDVFEICVCLCEVPVVVVSRVVFTSKGLGIEEDAFIDNGHFHVRIPGERTKDLPTGIAKYDITVILTDGERMTVQRDTPIEVVNKTNEVSEDG